MKLNLEKLDKKNICLIGSMGSGKSVIAKILSKEFGLKFWDTDLLIEKKTNKSINDIFLENGEKYFRTVEEDIVLSTLDYNNCIISLWGGAILSNKIRKKLQINSFTIFLKVKIEVLYERLKKSKKRPLLKNVNIKEKIIKLSQERDKYYKNANLIVNNSKNTETTIIEIKKYLKKYYE